MSIVAYFKVLFRQESDAQTFRRVGMHIHEKRYQVDCKHQDDEQRQKRRCRPEEQREHSDRSDEEKMRAYPIKLN